MARELSLGTLFKGSVDASFTAAINELKRILGGLNDEISSTGEAAKAQKSAMRSLGSDFSALQLAAGRLTTMNRRLGEGFSTLADRYGTFTETSVKNLERGFLRTERAIQAHANSMIMAGKNGRFFEEHANRANIYLAEQAGRIKFVKQGLEQLASTQKSTTIPAAAQSAQQFTEFQLAMGRASNQSSAFQRALASGAETFNAYSGTALKNLESRLYRTEAAIQSHARSMTSNGRAGEAWAQKVDRLSLMMDEAAGSIKFTKNGIDDFGRSLNEVDKVSRKTEGVLSRFGKTLQSMAYWGTAAMVVYGVVNALKSGVAAVIEFDQSMKNLQAITGSTNAEVVVMGKTILSLSKSTRYSAVEIADGMTLLAQAGLSATESIEAMHAAAILAQGTLSGMKEITDLLTTVMEAYNLKASDTGRIADVMAIAMNKSKLDVEKLRIAFSYLAPAASESGLSLEETAAAASLLANAGLRASTIGTSFRQTLARLISPNEKLRTSFINSGADMSKLNPLTNSLKDVLVEMTRVVPTAAKAFELFGLRAAPAVIQLTRAVKDGNPEYDEMLQSMYDVGSAATMAAKQMEGLGSRTKVAVNSIINMGIAMGRGGLGDALGFLADSIKIVTSFFTDFVNSTVGQYVTAISSATLVTVAFGKALKLLGAGTLLSNLIMSFSSLAMAISTVRNVLVSLATVVMNHPVLAFAAVITAVIAGFVTWGRRVKEAGDQQTALSIESRRTEERLTALRNELLNSGKESNEYRRAIKELANEFKELAPLIDTVTGKWVDETEGMRILTQLIDKNHNQAMVKAIQSLIDYKREYDNVIGHKEGTAIFDPITNWISKLRDSKEVLNDMEIAVRSIVPALKDMGITAESSLKEVSDSLLIINPDLGRSKAKEAAAAILNVLKKMQAEQAKQEEEAAKAKLKREELLAKGIIKDVPLLYAEMYNDLDGLRRADSEAIEKKLEDDIDKVNKSVAEGSLSYKAGYAQIIAYQLEAIEKIAQIRWKDVGTQADIDKTILEGVQRLYKKLAAEYYNDRREAVIQAEQKISDAKGNQKAIQLAHEELNTKLIQLDEKYKSESRALWTEVMENRVSISREAREKLQAEMPKVTEPMSMDVGIPQPQQPFVPFGTVTDQSRLNLARRYVDEMKTILNDYKTGVHDWAAEVEKAWEGATEAEKLELGDQLRIARSVVNLTLTPSQVAKSAAQRTQQALKQFRDSRNAEQKADLESTRKFQDDNRKLLEQSTKGVDPRVKAMGEYERKLQEYRENTRDLIQMIQDDWAALQASTKRGEKVQIIDLDISKFKTAEEAVLYIKEDAKKTEQFMEKQNQLELESIRLESQNKKLGLEQKGLDFQKGIIKERKEILLDAAKQELEVDKWATQQRLETISMGGLSEKEIEQKVAEFKTGIRKATNDKIEKLDLQKQEDIIRAEQSHLSQLSENTSGYERVWNQLQEDLIHSHRISLEQRALNEKYGVEALTNIDADEQKRNKAAYERYTESLKTIGEKLHKKRLKEIEDEIDARTASLQAAEYLNRIEAVLTTEGTVDRLKAEEAYAQNILRIYTELYPDLKRLREANEISDEDFARYLKKWMDAATAERRSKEALYQELHRYDEEYYRQGKITADDYYNYLNTLRAQGAITEKEYKDKIIVEYGTFFERLKLGWNQAKAAAETWGETVVRVGREIGTKVTDEAVGALDLFGDSAESASQRFANAARNVLKWLAEMIIKQQLLNLLQGGQGGGGGLFGLLSKAITSVTGGAAGYSGAGTYGVNPGDTNWHAKGDYWFREPTFAVGLKTGTRHMIAEKKPEYLAGPNGSVQPNVTVQPVVKTEFIVDPNLRVKIEEGPTRQEAEETIKTVHLRALATDENYLNMHRSFVGGS